MTSLSIGTAGWSIPRELADRFSADGSALQRYASVMPAVEINSSFHRPHRASTWQRWGESVPDHFRFSVKLPKVITHEAKLINSGAALARFLDEVGALQGKLAVLLVQLPPKLAFEASVAEDFFADLKRQTSAAIACEPRHQSWFANEADRMLERLEVARVAADPARFPGAGEPGGWRGLAYWRLHGSPVMYRSSYRDCIDTYATSIAAHDAREKWCIFDNTASSAALGDALALASALAGSRS